MRNRESIAEATTPLDWPWAQASPPTASSETSTWQTALIRRWEGTSAVMVQPPLNHHYIVMHLGGAKHVTRKRDGPRICNVVAKNALTLVPAGNAYVWDTQGPIAFAHLYLKPEQLAESVVRDFEQDGKAASLIDHVGCRDALLEPLFGAMVQEIEEAPGPSRLRMDCLYESFCFQLVHRHTARSAKAGPRVVALAPHRLRRVLDFVEAHLSSDLCLADLATAAGTGQSHFSRAFQISTGCAPYRYLLRRRVEHAKVLLLTSELTLDAIGNACGFLRTAQFASMFKKIVGVGPKRFRIAHRRR